METSLALAHILGPLLVVAGLAFLLHFKRMQKMIKEFTKSPTLVYFAGGFNLIFGLVILEIHNVWEPNWTLLITLMGLFALLRGVLVLLFPDLVTKGVKMWKSKSNYTLFSVVLLLLGVFLCYMSYL